MSHLQDTTQDLFPSLQLREQLSPGQMHPMTMYYGSFLSGPNYCQPENIDPSLTLLSTTSSVFEGAQGTALSCVSEAPHLAADTPDMFAESWVFCPREPTCEGCPLQDSSRSVAPLPSQVDQETTMPVPDQALAVCHIHPEQQQCQYGGPRLASETGHNQVIADIMNQQRGSTGPIADFPSDWPEGDCSTIMMPWDPSFIFYGEILAEPFEKGHFNHRELRSDAPDGEVLRVPDNWEMTYATGEENPQTDREAGG
ncbi:Ig-like domain-containing protein [Fusarium sp. Ph1]|nr:Ig-like domain-containing protein [Fusarium sp. Ph1]